MNTYRGTIGDNFRFIIVDYSNSNDKYPLFLLSNSIKIYYESDKGVK